MVEPNLLAPSVLRARTPNDRAADTPDQCQQSRATANTLELIDSLLFHLLRDLLVDCVTKVLYGALSLTQDYRS